MKRLTSAQLFGAPKSARKTKARLARAKSLIVAAREHAAVTAQRYSAQALARPMHPPTVLQRRRVAERLNAKSLTLRLGTEQATQFLARLDCRSPPIVEGDIRAWVAAMIEWSSCLRAK